MAAHLHSFEAMGTKCTVSLWDEISDEAFGSLCAYIQEEAKDFEAVYSRFLPDSLVTHISQAAGEYDVPEDFVTLLRLYEKGYEVTGGKFTPLIGTLLEDLGYDASYSLTEKSVKRKVPAFPEVVTILSDTKILTKEPVLFDFGAIGKGFFVDTIVLYLKKEGYTHFSFDASGDMWYEGPTSITVGLEDPHDTSRVIGTMELNSGALCGSATNRRAWGSHHHYLDPHSLSSTKGIDAVWVYADSTTKADLLTSLLFFVEAEKLSAFLPFEYCVFYTKRDISFSKGFGATFFTT